MKYSGFLKDLFEQYTTGKRVLELGASCGIHTEIVREYADTLFTVDPHIRYDPGGDITPDFYGTANDYYKQVANPEFDVVLCLGLLYHLHSPFHLLEQIVNLSKPKVLIVESLKKDIGGTAREIDWAQPGNAHADVDIEYPLQINCGPKGEQVVMALETTPMKLDKFYEYGTKWQDSVVSEEFMEDPRYEMVSITDWLVPTYAGGNDERAKGGMWLATFTR
jgi:hypothetical protein